MTRFCQVLAVLWSIAAFMCFRSDNNYAGWSGFLFVVLAGIALCLAWSNQ